MKKNRFLAWFIIVCVALATLLPFSIASAQGATVSIAAPANVTPGSTFVARVNVSQVTNFKAYQLRVTYDPNVIQVIGAEGGAEGVTPGLIDSTVIPLSSFNPWVFSPSGVQGTIEMLGIAPGTSGVTGSGYLAEIHFLVVGTPGDTSNIAFTTRVGFNNGLFNNLGQQITPLTLVPASVQIPTQFNLNVGSTGGGNATQPGEGVFPYAAGTVVNLLAEADPGFAFVNWTGDVGTVADVNAAATTITMDGDYIIQANFVPRYTLTAGSTDGGDVTQPGEGAFTYDAGTVVDLLAVPDDGFIFVNWTGDVGTVADVNAAATTITMDGDYTIQANFAVRYTLTAGSTAGGDVTQPGEGAFPYGAGTVVDLLAVADAGFIFVNWTGDVGTVADVNAAATTITMDGDYTIQANFVRGDADGNGVINMADAVKVERIILELDSPTPGADANGDGFTNMGDVVRIELIILGLYP